MEGKNVSRRLPLYLSLLVAATAIILLLPANAAPRPSGPVQSESNPLSPFEQLVGGQWHLDGSYHEFEWGLGRQSVTTRSYFVVEGEPMLVSEGIWYWHPGEKVIKGAFTAIEMPVVFFDYTVRFENDKMIADLIGYDAAGSATSYVETWEFVDDTHYEWKLLSETPDGLQEVMGGNYLRKK
jgi:hypothetical protein